MPHDESPVSTLPSSQACLIDALSVSLQLRDAYTHGHCDRVGLLAQRLARCCDMDAAASAQVALAARFHDIGKIGTPDAILLAPRRHTDEERDIMREHPVHGEQIFLATGRHDAVPVARLIRAHHEAYDGSGYPDGLRGDAIPLGARIMTVADAYDAMTSARPYRAAMAQAPVLRILDDQAGGLIDPYVLKQFQQMLAQAPALA
ncbi:HD domain-containing phosphohydrolase [Stenotrophomonas sp. 24(2023)]|uniref:HD-GYP domain-containing protein n=1 Tax=Stenotrophomonas sp. 24(2023) TaxID=3068324 RepID=UPI0027DF7A1B|nr:HD domain-containing phosphohydrolase [Stenotrophomonas sp. 24(2023)]WMJ68431.1 HD domain-containing phosphohydrolase [Stenotrophomonas sp. 24(2023)]